MATNLPFCFFIQFLDQLLKFPVNFTLLKYVKSQRSYGFLITKKLIFGFQILDLKVHFSASLTGLCLPLGTLSAVPAPYHPVECSSCWLFKKGSIVDCETWKRTKLRLTEYENLRQSDDTKIQNYNVLIIIDMIFTENLTWF